MTFIMYLNVYLFPLILLVIVCSSIRGSVIQTMDNRLYIRLIWSTCLLMTAELLAWLMDGRTFPGAGLLVWGMNIAYFMLVPCVSLAWLDYLCFQLYKKTLFVLSGRAKLALAVPLVLYYGIILLSGMTHLVFWIGSSNFYVRGRYAYLPYTLSNAYMLVALIMIIRCTLAEFLSVLKRQYMLFGIITVLPMAAAVLQFYFDHIRIIFPVTAIAELMLYILLQRQQITIDPLTGINNRACFNSYLAKQMEHKETDRQLYLFMMDMNHFKGINDTYGHDVGDEALKHAARILSDFFHRSNAFVARYGGDEFCVIKPCQNDREAQLLAEQLEGAFEKAGYSEQYGYTLSFSIGFARLKAGDAALREDIIQRADEMMYQNKKRGRSA